MPTPTNPSADVAPSTGRQVLRFGVVGIVGFLTDVGGFNLLRFGGGQGPLHDAPLTAKVVSGLAATVVAWLGSRYWTFRHTRRQDKHREFLTFTAVAVLGTLIALACLGISHYVLGFTSPLADNIAGNGIGLALGTLFRFWAYRQHVFTGDVVTGGLAHSGAAADGADPPVAPHR